MVCVTLNRVMFQCIWYYWLLGLKCTIFFCEALFLLILSHSPSLPVSPSRFLPSINRIFTDPDLLTKDPILYVDVIFPLSELLPCATSLRRRLFLHRLACLPLFWDTKQLLKYNIFFYSLDKFWSNNLSDVKYTWNNSFFFYFFMFFFFIYGFIFLFLSINDINGYCLIGRSRDYLRAVYLGQIEFNKNRKPITFFSSVILFCC